jgi:hypothetical protein
MPDPLCRHGSSRAAAAAHCIAATAAAAALPTLCSQGDRPGGRRLFVPSCKEDKHLRTSVLLQLRPGNALLKPASSSTILPHAHTVKCAGHT